MHTEAMLFIDDNKCEIVKLDTLLEQSMGTDNNRGATIRNRCERFAARASVLSDAEKERVWPAIKDTIPQMNVYEGRTDRNIRVFRLTRIAGNAGAAQ